MPKFRRRQRSTSIFFLIWAVFSALALAVVLFFSIPQQWIFFRSYKREASESVSAKGKVIETEINGGLPIGWNSGWSAYVRRLSYEHQVRIFILDENGVLRFPEESTSQAPSAEDSDWADFAIISQEMAEAHLEKIIRADGEYTVYENGEEFVYGAEVTLDKQNRVTMYLYVGQSLELMNTALKGMTLRIILLAVFVFLLCFAVSSAVAGWLVKPITEITQKARRLAQGDFDMDFHGNDYGKEMVELADALNFARDELSKTDRMQKELIANVSHDFKTPLTMIKAYASMIIEISGEIPEKRNKHAQVIVDEADRLTSLVSDVLDLSKISSGIQALECKLTDMSACVHEALQRFEYLKETQAYIFVTDIEEGLFASVDELRIGQALYNLIGNAVNYTGEDKKVYVRLKREENGFRFSVTDTGKGIKEEERGEIWERYYRSKDAHKRPVKGTGLGLSIVKTVLERHGLPYGVESKVGEGSTFYVFFPTEV